MRKHLLRSLIVILFILSLTGLLFSLPSSSTQVAQAAKATSVTFLGREVTEQEMNLRDTFDGSSFNATGYVSFSQGVLTLRNVSLSNYNGGHVIVAQGGDLDINIDGTVIMQNNNYASYVIYQPQGSLKILGGKLIIEESNATPVVVEGGDIFFNASEIVLSHAHSPVRLDTNNMVNIRRETMLTLMGYTRAISNIDGDYFDRVIITSDFIVRAGESEDSNSVVKNYSGQNYLQVYTKPLLECENNVFDLYKPASIKVKVTVFNNDFMGISGLNLNTDYLLSNVQGEPNSKIVELKAKNFEEDRIVGVRELTFKFTNKYDAKFEIMIIDSTPTELITIFPTNAIYDADVVSRVIVKINHPEKFAGIVGNVTREDYTYDSETGELEFHSSFMHSFPNGSYMFSFVFEGGISRNFILTVVNSVNADIPPPSGDDSAIWPTQDTYDKYSIKPEHKPIVVSLVLNGNTLMQVYNGLNQVASKYWLRFGDSVIITEEYLSKLKEDEYVLTFEFNGGESQVFNLRVINTDPLPDGRSPYPDGISFSSNSDSITRPPPDIVDGEGDTAALVVVAIFAAVGALSLVVWIILRKKRIV